MMIESENTASSVLRSLVRKSGKTVKSIAKDAGINENTLYAIVGKNTDLINIRTMDSLAKYFGYDITVFLGLDNYEPKEKLSSAERELLALFRGSRADVRQYILKVVKAPPEPLTEAEENILRLCHGFNDRGLQRVLELCEDMEAGGRYSKA